MKLDVNLLYGIKYYSVVPMYAFVCARIHPRRNTKCGTWFKYICEFLFHHSLIYCKQLLKY